jgi:hypothetical protein
VFTKPYLNMVAAVGTSSEANYDAVISAALHFKLIISFRQSGDIFHLVGYTSMAFQRSASVNNEVNKLLHHEFRVVDRGWYCLLPLVGFCVRRASDDRNR